MEELVELEELKEMERIVRIKKILNKYLYLTKNGIPAISAKCISKLRDEISKDFENPINKGIQEWQ